MAAYAGNMRWLLSVIAGFLFVLIPATGAVGHAGLLSSNPEDGASLDVAPDEVVLTFSEELLSDLVEISVLDADDTPVVVTEVPQTPPPGTDVKLPWPTDLPPGEYSVAFRVVSADGHPVTGRITFSYTSAVQEAPTPEVSPSPSESITQSSAPQSSAPQSPDVQTGPEITQETSPAPTPEPIATADEPSSSLIGPLLIAAAVIVGIGVIVSIVMLARSRQ